MAANKKPRKKRTIKHVPGMMPIVWGVAKETCDELALQPHLSLVSLQFGHGCEEHAWVVANSLKVGAKLVTMDEHKRVVAAGLIAITNLIERGKQAGRWVCTGDELKVLKMALTVSDQMQKVSTRRERRDALLKVYAEA